jgi:hypothetical protein
VFTSVIQDDWEKLAGFIESHNCLSLIVNALFEDEKCIKCVHHKKKRSLFIKKTIIGIQW